MKILLLECTEEELRANRTIMDTITDALNTFTEGLVGANITPSQVASALSQMEEESESEE